MDEDPPIPSALPGPGPAPAAAPPAAKRLLIVDHHAVFANQLKGMFEAAGCAVELRSDAVSGGAGIKEFTPHAAVVDLDLPGGGGKIVHRVLRTNAATRDIPIVLLAAPGTRDIWAELGSSPHPSTLALRRAADMRLLLPVLRTLLGLD